MGEFVRIRLHANADICHARHAMPIWADARMVGTVCVYFYIHTSENGEQLLTNCFQFLLTWFNFNPSMYK